MALVARRPDRYSAWGAAAEPLAAPLPAEPGHEIVPAAGRPRRDGYCATPVGLAERRSPRAVMTP